MENLINQNSPNIVVGVVQSSFVRRQETRMFVCIAIAYVLTIIYLILFFLTKGADSIWITFIYALLVFILIVKYNSESDLLKNAKDHTLENVN